MATKVKPTRLNISGTIQQGQVPIYVNDDCFGVGTIPTDNCELANGCGYLQSCDLACYAQCCDIPTDNCQLANGCGYITGINCNDVTTALGYTPYDCTNPSGYTTCTGTLVPSDIQNLAQCCDIPTDNCQLANGCGYQKTACMVCDFTSPDNNTYPTTEAVCCYVGTKIANAYIYKGTVNTYEDLPTTGLTSGDVYNVTNAHTTSPEFPAGANLAWNGTSWDVLGGIVDLSSYAKCCDIPTDNCQLLNGCGYTTCTGTLVPNDIANLAQCCDIPTNNCQLLNGCGYTTCTGTVVAGDLAPYAKSCDLCAVATSGKYCDLSGRVTDNCQIGNGCGYTTCTGTLSTCADVISALGYTPYNSTNPNGYTSCTGTVTNSDLACYTQCCDMPNMSCYQQVCNLVCDLTGADNIHYPSAKAVADAIGSMGGGDMLKSVYDPNNHSADAFDYCNFTNTPTIPTDNSQLANGCGYTTCTGTLQACDIANLAQCCDIPTNNNQLTNGCGYTTCTGTLSSCADIISALGYTPYSSANPSGYTSCTGTLVPSDLNNYAKCCDIPTDNCQLSNGCGYTTCTGTLNGGDLKTVNGNCLVGSGDICIQAGVTSVNGCTGAVCLTIPTDNCQLGNGCGYTTCTGTLNGGDLKTVNGCCLVGSGDICISGGADYSWQTKTITGGEVELGLRTIVNNPTSNFTLTMPATLQEGEEYVIRTISDTSYCMCLGSCFTNPWCVSTCLSGKATDQYVFLAICGELELQPLVATGS